MTITNYGELKAEVASWLNKSNISSKVAGFVQIAESYIRRDLKVRTQEITVSDLLQANETLPFPERFASVRRLVVDGRQCKYITPEEYTNLDLIGADQPTRLYTIIGENIVILGGTSGDAYTLVYSEWFTGLDQDTDTNWVLTYAPDVYLWASCMAGSVWLKDVNATTAYKTLYEQSVRALDNSEKEARAGYPLVIRPETVE
jgi:hypothetical protein